MAMKPETPVIQTRSSTLLRASIINLWLHPV